MIEIDGKVFRIRDIKNFRKYSAGPNVNKRTYYLRMDFYDDSVETINSWNENWIQSLYDKLKDAFESESKVTCPYCDRGVVVQGPLWHPETCHACHGTGKMDKADE